MTRDESKLSRRRRRSRLRGRVVGTVITIGVGSEKGTVPEAGALGERAAEIREWIGM